MLWTRTKSVLVMIPLLIAVTLIGGLPYDLFFFVVMILAAREYYRLLKTMGYYVSQPILVGGVAAFMLHRSMIPDFLYTDLLLVSLILIIAILALIRYEKGDAQAVLSFALHLSGILYLGWMGGYFISMAHLPGGRWWTLFIFAVIWLVDTGAFFVGSRYGKHKISLRLSPKKSWEGLLAGLVTGVLVGVLLSTILQNKLPGLNPVEGALIGLLIGLVTPFGDVFISLLKRVAGVKDSGNVIPGHGGILDRIDTWIWAMMVGYYLIILFT